MIPRELARLMVWPLEIRAMRVGRDTDTEEAQVGAKGFSCASVGIAPNYRR